MRWPLGNQGPISQSFDELNVILTSKMIVLSSDLISNEKKMYLFNSSEKLLDVVTSIPLLRSDLYLVTQWECTRNIKKSHL